MVTNTSEGAVRLAKRASAAWLILAILLLFSIATPLNQFKVPLTIAD